MHFFRVLTPPLPPSFTDAALAQLAAAEAAPSPAGFLSCFTINASHRRPLKHADAHAHVFTRDKTTNLVVRLRRNVIRVGLRRVSLAYTKIHLADVASKLGLGKDDDIECVVAKAVRDGGIDGMIDHDAQIMYSKDISDVYGTTAPQDAFHARIAFCLDTHNEAVVAMRYAAGGKTPARASRKTFNEADGAEELAMHIGDDDDMDEF